MDSSVFEYKFIRAIDTRLTTLAVHYEKECIY